MTVVNVDELKETETTPIAPDRDVMELAELAQGAARKPVDKPVFEGLRYWGD